MKKWEEFSTFLENYILIGSCKFFFLWREYLSSEVNVLSNSPKT